MTVTRCLFVFLHLLPPQLLDTMDGYEAEFSWPSSDASDVVLTGSFDNWSCSIHLPKGASGFAQRVRVPWDEKIPYKFIVDGRWVTRDDRPTEFDGAGNLNNILLTPSKPAYSSMNHPHDHPLYQDRNQSNQYNEYYVNLRAKAIQQGDEMARCFKQSREAYERHERALAKELSEKGKQHGSTMEALNAEASAWIFRENNLDSKPCESDLHGLFVKEAISYADKAIKGAKQRGDSQICFIVGKGLHSRSGAKIRPALEGLTRQHNLVVGVDPQNEGVLIVQLA